MRHAKSYGFTLIELLVVMTIIGMLLSLAVPRYFHSVDKSRETVLRENLVIMRDSIDKYYGDRGRYPDSLEDLVTRKYLRAIPTDPITQSAATWQIVAPEGLNQGAVYDIKSGATEKALDGTAYAEW